MIPAFYSSRPHWPARVEEIVESLVRISVLEELSGRGLELRRTNRIGSVHSSTAIEGNGLTLAQVTDLANGGDVFAPPREVMEVQNAFAAYEALDVLNPWSVDDFLRAHGLLTAGLVVESGAFRTVDVEIVHPDGRVLHTGSRVEKVPRLVAELFEWAQSSADHPLVVSSAVHFLIEHIHPFRDGNGRIGRLWQTLILSRWRPMFAWLPTESLIRKHQEGYYRALQESREPEIDAGAFVDFMLDVIAESVAAFAERARPGAQHVGVNVGVNVGVDESILALLRLDPSLSAAALAQVIGKTPRTVERRLAALKQAGRLRREGPDKSGKWVVVE